MKHNLCVGDRVKAMHNIRWNPAHVVPYRTRGVITEILKGHHVMVHFKGYPGPAPVDRRLLIYDWTPSQEVLDREDFGRRSALAKYSKRK